MLYSSSRSLTLGGHRPSASCPPPPVQGFQPPGLIWTVQGDWPSRLPQGSTLRALQLTLLLATLTWWGLLSSLSLTKPLSSPEAYLHISGWHRLGPKSGILATCPSLSTGGHAALSWSLQLVCAAPRPQAKSLVITPASFCSKKTFFFF